MIFKLILPKFSINTFFFLVSWTLTPPPSVNSLGPMKFFGSIRSLKLGVSLVLDPSVNSLVTDICS